MPTAITLEQHRMMLILVTCITFAPCLLLISIVEIVQKIGVNLNHCICSLSGRNGHIMREGINATWVEHASGERYSFWAGSIRARLHLNVDKKKNNTGGILLKGSLSLCFCLLSSATDILQIVLMADWSGRIRQGSHTEGGLIDDRPLGYSVSWHAYPHFL